MYWHPVQGVFPTHTHCSWDRLQIHHNPDQDNVVTKQKLNEVVLWGKQSVYFFAYSVCVTWSFLSIDFTGIPGTIGVSDPGVFLLCLVHLPSEQTLWWWSRPAGTLLHAAPASHACYFLCSSLAAVQDWVMGVGGLSRNNEVNTVRPISSSR